MSTKTKYATIDMPMNVFINALVDGDYSQVENFDEILNDYYISIGGKELEGIIKNQMEIELLKSKILSAQNWIATLMLKPNNEDFEELKKLNYHLQVPAPDLDNIENYCNQINGWIWRDVDNLRDMEKEIKQDGNQAKVEYSRDLFADTFIEFSVTFKLNINDTISVREYCRYAVKYKQYAKKLKETQNQAA